MTRRMLWSKYLRRCVSTYVYYMTEWFVSQWSSISVLLWLHTMCTNQLFAVVRMSNTSGEYRASTPHSVAVLTIFTRDSML